jgi:hypothetical protein
MIARMRARSSIIPAAPYDDIGQKDKALDLYRQALDMQLEVGDRYAGRGNPVQHGRSIRTDGQPGRVGKRFKGRPSML